MNLFLPRKSFGSPLCFRPIVFVRILALGGLAAWGIPSSAQPISPVAPVENPSEVKPGQKVENLSFDDVKGNHYSTETLAEKKAVVFVTLGTECPVAGLYTPRIQRFAQTFASKGVQVLGVFANQNDSPKKIARFAKERKLGFPLVRDEQGRLARQLGARMTPEAFLVDASGILRYRGRIDDNQESQKVTRSDLKDAVAAVLDGGTVRQAETRAFGCFIAYAEAAAIPPAAKVTFARDVAPLLQKHCQPCHRPGAVGPMPFLSYEQVKAFAPTIKDVTQRRVMPPWHAGDNFGNFKYSRRLTDGEVATLASWADSGAPFGSVKDLPAPRVFPTGWQLGQPDVIYQSDEPYEVAAEGADVYRNYVIPTHFDGDRYVSAIEVHPDNTRVVHHIIAYEDFKGQSVALDAKDPGPGYTSSGGGIDFNPDGMIGGWAPGNEPRVLPDGVAILLPKNAYIVMQVHYHKNGKAEKDRSQIGLYFAKKPVNKLTQPVPVVNLKMIVPPGDAHHLITADWTVPEDLHAISIMPHMHLLGREMKVTATRPDGTVIPLVNVPDWDFRWQDTYVYEEPIALPKGTKVSVEAYYDNSEGNPNNPNKPPKEIHWGEQTTDEMCLAYVSVTQDSQNLAISPPVTPEAAATKISQAIPKR